MVVVVVAAVAAAIVVVVVVVVAAAAAVVVVVNEKVCYFPLRNFYLALRISQVYVFIAKELICF